MEIYRRMAAGMAEASRLTRAGQLLQATAIIKDTLRGLLTKKASSHATACTDDKIDVSFRVIDEAPFPTVGPPPRRLPSPGSASAEFTKGREEQHSGVSSTSHNSAQSEHLEPMRMQHRWTPGFRTMFRSHQSGHGRPLS